MRRCIACNRAEPFERFYERDGFAMVRCPECGLVFQDPQPGDEASASLYYDSPAFAARLEGELRATTIARAREKLALLARAGVAPPGTALDVGCSSGAWLELAKDTGWDPVGVEMGTAVAAAARRRGFEVHTGSLSDADLAGRRFDLVTFWDVLEHLPDPLDALIRARRLLRPGGVVALTFPNVEGLYPRATRRLIAERTGVWEQAELPAHLFDFSPRTARLVLRRAGLEATTVRTSSIPFDFYRDTMLAHQLPGRGARDRLLRLAFEILRAGIYPVARLLGRGNALFAAARPAGAVEALGDGRPGHRGPQQPARTAAGTVVNGAFQVGVVTLGVLKGLIVAAFLEPSEYAIWGILVVSIASITLLKQVGVRPVRAAERTISRLPGRRHSPSKCCSRACSSSLSRWCSRCCASCTDAGAARSGSGARGDLRARVARLAAWSSTAGWSSSSSA